MQQQAILTDPSGREIALPASAAGMTPKMVAFCRYVSFGLSYTAAIRAAGYQPKTPDACKAMGSQLASDPRCAELIRVFTQAMLKSAAPSALKTLADAMADPKIKSADRIKAATVILNKSQPTRTAHQIEADVTHHVQPAAPPARDRLAAMYAEAGMEPPPHLRIAAPVQEPIDADFEVLEPAGDRPEWDQ